MSEIFATSSRTIAPDTALPDTSVSWNFTGTAELSLKMLDPSGLIGCWMPPYMYCTAVVHDALLACGRRCRSRSRDVVLRTDAAVSIVVVPDGSTARPDCASDAAIVLLADACSSTAAGQVTPDRSGSSRRPARRQRCRSPTALPTLSLTVPLIVCEPLVLFVTDDGTEDGVDAGARAAVGQRRIAVVGERAGDRVLVPAAAARVVRASGRR